MGSVKCIACDNWIAIDSHELPKYCKACERGRRSVKYILETIPHEDQRYDTVGDWIENEDGSVTIRVSKFDTGDQELNEDYAFLVGLHEMVEQKLCKKRGITMADVDAFDKKFEADRAKGLHGENEEPGGDNDCIYRKEHELADIVERTVAHDMGILWDPYNCWVMAMGSKPDESDPTHWKNVNRRMLDK